MRSTLLLLSSLLKNEEQFLQQNIGLLGSDLNEEQWREKSSVASSSQKMNLLLHSKYLIEVSVVESSLKKYVIYKLVMSGILQVLQLTLHRTSTGKILTYK